MMEQQMSKSEIWTVAAKTAIIRNMMEHITRYPNDKKQKIYLLHTIAKRKKRLKVLRTLDYKKFEWVLEKLDLEYRPTPFLETVERKKSIRRLTDKYCEDYRYRKLQEYRQELHAQKTDFLKNKVATLEWARNEEIECGVANPTVKEEMIDEAKEQLEDHLSTIEVVKEVDKEFSIEI